MSGTTITPLVAPEELRAALDDSAAAALDQLVAETTAEPAKLDRLFPAAARRTARGPLPGKEILIEDAVRVELVVAAATSTGPSELVTILEGLYNFGDSDEKRAVLAALNGAGPELDGTDLLRDALRTNDTRLVAAAMGAHASRLDDEAWRHGVLKCLFTGVPVSAVAALTERADAELGRMAGRYQREREAAGREVPADVGVVLAACPQPTETSEVGD